MKFIAVLSISILIIWFVHSSSISKNLPKVKSQNIQHPLSSPKTSGNQLKPASNVKPTAKLPEKLPEILQKDVKALQGCFYGRCTVNKGVLDCFCKICKSKMTWKRVCVGPKGNQRCLCERNCVAIEKPKGCLAKYTSSEFFITWWGQTEVPETLTHLACACWKEYESNCKLDLCKKVKKYNDCILNLRKQTGLDGSSLGGRHSPVSRSRGY